MPIKELKFLREDDLARRVRKDDSPLELRCLPIIYQGHCYNLFIDGTVVDKEIMKAITQGNEIDTSDSVNPRTFESLIVDI